MNHRKRNNSGRPLHGFTLIELLVVMAIIGILVGLMLPALSSVREAARRTQCRNNMKQINLALQSFHEARGSFPEGGSLSSFGSGNKYGHSWWLYILPHIEQSPLQEEFDLIGKDYDGTTGWTGGLAGNYDNQALLDGVELPFLQCPSSPLPVFAGRQTSTVISSTYTGISGGADDGSTVDAAGGKQSDGGVLLNLASVSAAAIRDGMSNTIIVGEQSDWCRDASGNSVDCRSDCAHGFTMGPAGDGSDRRFNIVTVLHPLNEKSATALGVGGNCGPNSPLQSVHPRGVNLAFCDGSVRFVADRMDIQTLYDLSNRADGNPLDDDTF